MKKLVAISVLLAILAAAVFAQEESKEGKWKVGFMARYVTDMLYATSMNSEKVSKKTFTQTPGPAPDDQESTEEFGKFNKGSIDFFGNQTRLPHADNRLLVSISNTGENYDVYADIKLDDWAHGFSGVLPFLSQGFADWWVKGNAGIFNAQIGTASYEGFVSPLGPWNDWMGGPGDYQLSKFGVWKYAETATGAEKSFVVSDNFRTWYEWGTVFGLGATLADNYRLSVGYRLNPDISNVITFNPDVDPFTSRSNINGSFMVSGRFSDAFALDLFYSVIGCDPDTFARPVTSYNPTTGVYTNPPAYWSNVMGAYIGLNLGDLGLSLGYTANFDAYETLAYYDYGETNITKSNPRTVKAPFFSGLDIHVSYSLDKIGLTFNNNLSFAGVKATEVKQDSKEVILGISGEFRGDGEKEDWFHWDTELQAKLALIENVNLIVHLGNQLGVFSSETKEGDTKTTSQRTKNVFRVSASAEYGIGAVTVGTGLFFSVKTNALEGEQSGSGSFKADTNVVSFGIPVLFKVAF